MEARFHRFVSILALMTMGIALAACAGGPDQPGWVKGKPKDFPAEQYTFGVGSGGDPAQAAEAAIAELARKTKGESEGATIERKWLDEREKRHWALAVLDRTAAAERLLSRWSQADAEVAQLLASDVSGAPASSVVPALVRAIERAAARDALGARIGLLNGTPPPIDPARERARLEARFAEIKHTITIEVGAFEMDPETGAVGQPLEQIRTALAQAVLARGFRVGTRDEWGPSSAWLSIRAQVGIEPLQLGDVDRFTAVEWNAVVEVQDRSGDGELLTLQTKKARSTHVNLHSARREALDQARAFAVESLSSWMDERVVPRVDGSDGSAASAAPRAPTSRLMRPAAGAGRA